ncbi:MAG: alanine--tRNA ligase [PS1 clade bacterium]|uniref:Alanine--tRNA ligase n=1 Tax=PS1 clade bacterium TaxID=2175152 RepID=A0A937L6D1_9PROT|nr:alanine--tRNA ligase [PS1 clade bacterium]
MSSGLADIRSAFLDFFGEREHEVVASSPLVPLNDPTLLFTNAGMVPFKNYFTGQEQPAYQRAASSQKCVRAGGKHNDLDNVGYTARHHTFFEMLGNFSFGDYFKEDAIEYAWTFLTKELEIPTDKLLATVYAEDDEAFALWQKIAGLPEEKIIRIATSDNFWSMGDTGPCGPCSEIFFDHGESIAGGPPGSPDEDGDRFIEIWNLVFMQFEQQKDGSRIDLPKPSIDTGMGLERIGALLQGKHDNYDTDLMRHLIEASADHSGQAPDGAHGVSHRVIADHLRSSAFLIADGVLPSNEGRGYVLRRIMRRAMRHAHMLGTKEPLLWQLVPALKMQMAAAYPELERANALIVETLRHEEERFRDMLGRGLKLLDDEVGQMQGDSLPGAVAFKLYDTFGFPLDLTQDALRERGLSVDTDGFDVAMEKQRAEARANWSGSGQEETEAVWFDLRNEHGPTEFVGYQSTAAEGQVVAIVKDGAPVSDAKKGDEVALMLNQTPFYAESGGQVGDTGLVSDEDGLTIEISDTQKRLGDVHVLHGKVVAGTVSTGALVHQEIDGKRRDAIRANHSATHLLHEALRRVLGEHVTQKGSLVNEHHLRFDFSHPRAMNDNEIDAVEAMVNNIIRQNDEVATRLMTPDEAIEAGALALFGEKYGEEVRVLSMGHAGQEGANTDAAAYSVELCGGTHVRRLGDIGLLKISQEGAVASGVRRIEARTGEGALAQIAAHEHVLHAASNELKVAVEDLPMRVAKLVEERKALDRELSQAKKQLALMGSGDAANGGAQGTASREVNGTPFMARCLDGLPTKQLRGLVDDGKQQIGSGVVVFIGIDGDKAGIAVGVTDDLTDKFNAVDLVQAGAAALGGTGGGGRPDMAQSGGPDTDAADAAIAAIEKLL